MAGYFQERLALCHSGNQIKICLPVLRVMAVWPIAPRRKRRGYTLCFLGSRLTGLGNAAGDRLFVLHHLISYHAAHSFHLVDLALRLVGGLDDLLF